MGSETLRAIGYRCYGPQSGGLGRGEILWQRRIHEGVYLNITEWPPYGPITEPRYEMEVYQHDDTDAMRATLYSYDAATLAARLPELERRALAMLAASEVGTTTEREPR